MAIWDLVNLIKGRSDGSKAMQVDAQLTGSVKQLSSSSIPITISAGGSYDVYVSDVSDIDFNEITFIRSFTENLPNGSKTRIIYNLPSWTGTSIEQLLSTDRHKADNVKIYSGYFTLRIENGGTSDIKLTRYRLSKGVR